jgi:hypothetical protein
MKSETRPAARAHVEARVHLENLRLTPEEVEARRRAVKDQAHSAFARLGSWFEDNAMLLTLRTMLIVTFGGTSFAYVLEPGARSIAEQLFQTLKASWAMTDHTYLLTLMLCMAFVVDVMACVVIGLPVADFLFEIVTGRKARILPVRTGIALIEALPAPWKDDNRTGEHFQTLKNHLAHNPGSSTSSVLNAVYGRTLVTISEFLGVCYVSRMHGYGAAKNGLWYLVADNDEVREANLNDRPTATIEEATHAFRALRDSLGATGIDFSGKVH